MNIVLYVSDHCASCREAVHFFQEEGVSYQLLNVDFDKDNFNDMLSYGGIATPLIRIGNHIFHSFDREKIKEALQEYRG
ncbi:glutaredoxin family protein [Paenibacillus spongiae]|uniref:Glutaredoxin family protein n=1 Tax=Paenibacillus spongiae TaxID=2909671 RepID=A0ABY5SC15_9BACL|nr:glutaredoxin family protein [Paenibacillus spongiae]UVI30265.1 glutaredoxin family protein [Paenibacillus spongiae]